jgi:hypothetical protein
MAVLINRKEEEVSRQRAFLDVWRFRLNDRKVEKTSGKEKDWR